MSGKSWNTPRSICSSKTIAAMTPAVKIIDRPDFAGDEFGLGIEMSKPHKAA
jgi:hypothetical protein